MSINNPKTPSEFDAMIAFELEKERRRKHRRAKKSKPKKTRRRRVRLSRDEPPYAAPGLGDIGCRVGRCGGGRCE